MATNVIPTLTVNLEQTLICVEYPGFVKNSDNVMKTLGGLGKISETFTNEKMRLELMFRPDDLYSKACYGDKTSTTGVLLKVTVRKYKNKSKAEKLTSVHQVDVLGRIFTKYKFDSLCDFQYLVLHKPNTPNAKTEFIYKQIVPSGIVPLKWIEENRNAPYFLPPVSFTRIDSVQENLFKKEQQKEVKEAAGDTNTIIGRTRLRRNVNATYLPFDLTSPVPTKPHATAVTYLKAKFIPQEVYEHIKELFQKRAIWSRMAIEYESKVSSDQLKYILPTISYYYTNGPWRIMWVKFGYDPRKDFESRYLQTFDYRLRNAVGLKNYVKLKRGHSFHKPNVSQKFKNTTLIDISQIDEEPNSTKKLKPLYNPYFEPGMFPQSRQTFYQYCDIRVPKIQEMLDKIPTPMSGAVCSEKTGWFPQGFDDLCRDLITENVKDHHKAFMKKEEFDNDDEEEEEMSDEFDYNDNDDTNLEQQIEDMDIDDLI